MQELNTKLPRDLPYDRFDLQEVAAEYLAARMAGNLQNDAEPLTRELFRDEVRMSDLAASLRPEFYGTSGVERHRALTLSDFGAPLSSA